MTARLSKDQRNQVIGVLKAGSTVNDIAHRFGCSRQAIHYLMNRYNRTGYVRVRARPGRVRVTTLPLMALTQPTLSYYTASIIAHVYGAHAQKKISHFVQNNGSAIPA